MHAQLHDLRLLFLAHELERSYESLERALHRHLPAEVQRALDPLFQGGPSHSRLEARLKALNAEVQAKERDIGVTDILQALRDCERMARQFYLEHLDELSDPGLVELFRGLAAEEAKHLDAVDRAITVAEGLDFGRR